MPCEPVPARPEDAAEVLVLQRCCWVTEAIRNDTLAIPALHETLDDVRAWLGTAWVLRDGHRLIGGVRASLADGTWHVGRLMVAPDRRGEGLGRALLAHVEAVAPAEARRFALFTGRRKPRALRAGGVHADRLGRARGAPREAAVSAARPIAACDLCWPVR